MNDRNVGSDEGYQYGGPSCYRVTVIYVCLSNS